jgi:hypothetical protein
MESIIKAKKPKSNNWVMGHSKISIYGYDAIAYLYPEKKIYVISGVEVVKDNNDIEIGPEYHISISMAGRRVSSNVAKWVCNEFDMIDSEEDNHGAARARHFWKPVAETFIGRECPCKETEPAIKLDKGDYIYRPQKG